MTEPDEMTERNERTDDAMLAAIIALASGLELGGTLERIVRVAVEAVSADFGALGVLGPDGTVQEFRYAGIDPEEAAEIGPLPVGRGILGLLITDPQSLRLEDLREHPAAAGFPAHHPLMGPFLGTPIAVRGDVFGNLYLTRGPGSPGFSAADEQIVEQLAVAAGVAIENAGVYEQERARERYQEAVADVHEQLLTGVDVGEVLRTVALRAAELVRADVALMVLPDVEGQPVVEIVEVIASAEGSANPWSVGLSRAEGGDLTAARGLAGHRVDDWWSLTRAVDSGRPRSVDLMADQWPVPAVVERLASAYGPALFVPLKAADEGHPGGDQLWPGSGELDALGQQPGAVVLMRRAGDEAFDPGAMELAEHFASQASLALVMAQNRHDASRVAVLEERERIARDLHDLTIQRLFAAGLGLQQASARMRSEAADVLADQVDSAVDELYATISEIRSTIVGLSSHEQGSVRAAVLEQARAASAQLGTAPSVLFTGAVESRVDDVVADQMLAVLREALSNALRHSGADHVRIEVHVVPASAGDDDAGGPDTAAAPAGEPRVDQSRATQSSTDQSEGDEPSTPATLPVRQRDVLRLVVADDGRGISDDARAGSGLVNIARRAEDLGGTSEVVSTSEGVTVTWQVPLHE